MTKFWFKSHTYVIHCVFHISVYGYVFQEYSQFWEIQLYIPYSSQYEVCGNIDSVSYLQMCDLDLFSKVWFRIVITLLHVP